MQSLLELLGPREDSPAVAPMTVPPAGAAPRTSAPNPAPNPGFNPGMGMAAMAAQIAARARQALPRGAPAPEPQPPAQHPPAQESTQPPAQQASAHRIPAGPALPAAAGVRAGTVAQQVGVGIEAGRMETDRAGGWIAPSASRARAAVQFGGLQLAAAAAPPLQFGNFQPPDAPELPAPVPQVPRPPKSPLRPRPQPAPPQYAPSQARPPIPRPLSVTPPAAPAAVPRPPPQYAPHAALQQPRPQPPSGATGAPIDGAATPAPPPSVRPSRQPPIPPLPHLPLPPAAGQRPLLPKSASAEPGSGGGRRPGSPSVATNAAHLPPPQHLLPRARPPPRPPLPPTGGGDWPGAAVRAPQQQAGQPGQQRRPGVAGDSGIGVSPRASPRVSPQHLQQLHEGEPSVPVMAAAVAAAAADAGEDVEHLEVFKCPISLVRPAPACCLSWTACWKRLCASLSQLSCALAAYGRKAVCAQVIKTTGLSHRAACHELVSSCFTRMQTVLVVGHVWAILTETPCAILSLLADTGVFSSTDPALVRTQDIMKDPVMAADGAHPATSNPSHASTCGWTAMHALSQGWPVVCLSVLSLSPPPRLLHLQGTPVTSVILLLMHGAIVPSFPVACSSEAPAQ